MFIQIRESSYVDPFRMEFFREIRPPPGVVSPWEFRRLSRRPPELLRRPPELLRRPPELLRRRPPPEDARRPEEKWWWWK